MAFFGRGKPEGTEMLFSNKALVKIIVPLVLQQILTVTVGTVDNIMVAYNGEVAVSGVSLVNSLDNLLIVFFTALVSGGSVVVAQTLGRKREGDVQEAVKQLIFSATFFAAVLSAVVLLLREPILKLLFGKAEEAVMKSALDYFFFVALSFPLLAIDSSIAASFRASGNTFLAMLISFLMNIVNAGGNAVFIMGLKMGAGGAGLATLIARGAGAVTMLILLHRKKYTVRVERLFPYKPDFGIIKQILHIGIPNGIESAMFQLGRLMTSSLISSLGTAVIAGNSVARTITNYQYMTGTACGSAMIAVVGRCVGAKEEYQAKYYSRKILFINFVMMWAVCLFTMAMLGPILSLYNLSDYSTQLARTLISIHALAASLIWPFGFMLPSAFRAASDVRFTLVISSVSMWLFRVAGAYVLALETVSVFGLFSFSGAGLGIMGVWIAMFIDWIFRCSLYAIRFFSGRWLKILRQNAPADGPTPEQA